MNENQLKAAFKNWEHQQHYPELPEDHEDVFLAKLNAQKSSRKRTYPWQWAAVLLLCLSVGAGVWNSLLPPPSKEVASFQQAEAYFTQLINYQLDTIEKQSLPEGKKFMESYQKQIHRLQGDYQQLYEQWENQPQQSQLIQALIANLQTQLELLTELQEQIIYFKNNKNEEAIL